MNPALPVAFSLVMGTKSRDRLYGTSVRMAAERAAEMRREADTFACDAWNKRMLAFKGPAQPSPTLGDALNAGYVYLESAASAATPIRASPSTSCGGPRRRRSTSWSGTCGARTARWCGAMPTSAAIWSRSGGPRLRQAIRRRIGGRGSGEVSPFRTTIRSSHRQDEISATTASDKVGNQPGLR